MIESQQLIAKKREFKCLKVWERQINQFNRLLQKKGNITGKAPLMPLNQVPVETKPVPSPSQEGEQAGQVLSPRQVVLAPSQEGVQAV